MKRVRQTTAVSIVAMGSFLVPAQAQQGNFYNDPAFTQQPFPAQQPFGNQQLYIDPNTGIVMPQPPGGFQPQPGFQRQPQFQQQPQFVPQPGVVQQPAPAQAFFPEAIARPEAPTVPFTPERPQTAEPQPNIAPLRPAVQATPFEEPVRTPYYNQDSDSAPSAPSAEGSASEQATDFQTISPAASGDRAPTMAAELDELLRVGERYRAASPGFLDDLKALAAKYRDPLPAAPQTVQPFVPGAEIAGTAPALDPAQPRVDEMFDPSPDMLTGTSGVQPSVVVPPLDPGSISFAFLEDDFTDGELDNDPPWRMRQGEWYIDPTYGLRARQPAEASSAPLRPKEVLKSLLTGDAPEAGESTTQPRTALIETPTSIGNAFALAARVVDHAGTGTAHFIVHQGGANWLGYRLELRSGPQPVMVLTRRGSNGYKDITKVAIPRFNTGQEHELRWARLSDGQMIVLLDGKPVITSRDTVFREDWTGFAFFNAGGDVSIRALRIAAPVER